MNTGARPVGHRREWMPACAGMAVVGKRAPGQHTTVMPGLDPGIHVVGQHKPANNLMLSLSKYAVVALVSGGFG